MKILNNILIDDIIIKHISETDLRQENILNFIKLLDNDFIPPLSLRTNISRWSEKLYRKSIVLLALRKNVPNKIIGILCFYANNSNNLYSYIPFLGISKKHRRMGLARLMLNECFIILKKNNFKTIGVKTENNNSALEIYKKLGFKEIERLFNNEKNYLSVYLVKTL